MNCEVVVSEQKLPLSSAVDGIGFVVVGLVHSEQVVINGGVKVLHSSIQRSSACKLALCDLMIAGSITVMVVVHWQRHFTIITRNSQYQENKSPP